MDEHTRHDRLRAIREKHGDRFTYWTNPDGDGLIQSTKNENYIDVDGLAGSYGVGWVSNGWDPRSLGYSRVLHGPKDPISPTPK